jgi:hypothetical protein
MVGAVLLMIWVSRPAWQRIKGGFLETAAWARLLALKLLYDKLNEFQPFLYRGGAFLTALASALLITPVIDLPRDPDRRSCGARRRGSKTCSARILTSTQRTGAKWKLSRPWSDSRRGGTAFKCHCRPSPVADRVGTSGAQQTGLVHPRRDRLKLCGQ